jgi:hypothetical protein
MLTATLVQPSDERPTAVTAPGVTPTFPAGRYGRRRDPARGRRRWITAALAAILVGACVLIAVKLFQQYAQAPYRVRIISVTDLSDTAVTVTFEVTRPAGAATVCTVLAHSRGGEQVGRATVPVGADDPDETVVRVTYTLPTKKRPVTGEVPGCGPAPS